jgi:hypothetical protein
MEIDKFLVPDNEKRSTWDNNQESQILKEMQDSKLTLMRQSTFQEHSNPDERRCLTLQMDAEMDEFYVSKMELNTDYIKATKA